MFCVLERKELPGDNREERKQLCRSKTISTQAWTGPEGSRRWRRFNDNQHKTVVSLSAVSTGRIYPPRNILGTHFCKRLSRHYGQSAAGRIISMKNSNRFRDLPACSAVP